jgi:hypothetical protein
VARIEQVAEVQERCVLQSAQGVPVGNLAGEDNGEAGMTVVSMVDVQPAQWTQYTMEWKSEALKHFVRAGMSHMEVEGRMQLARLNGTEKENRR